MINISTIPDYVLIPIFIILVPLLLFWGWALVRYKSISTFQKILMFIVGIVYAPLEDVLNWIFGGGRYGS